MAGCCCDSGAYDEMDSEHSSVEGISRRQCPVVLFRCLGIYQLGLGVGLLVCGLIIGILGPGWYSWGGLLIGILELACGVLCVLSTCRSHHRDNMAYKRVASGQLRIHFWISVSILTAFGLSALLTTGFGGLGTCNRFDNESGQVRSGLETFNYESEHNKTRNGRWSSELSKDECNNVRNASIVVIVFMLLSVIAAILFIYLSCVFGERFGMGYKISTTGCLPTVATLGADEVAARQIARRIDAQITQEYLQAENQLYGRHLNVRDVIAQQQQLQQFQQQQCDNRNNNIHGNDQRRGQQRQQLHGNDQRLEQQRQELQVQHEQLVQDWFNRRQQHELVPAHMYDGTSDGMANINVHLANQWAAHGGASDVAMGDVNVHVVNSNQVSRSTYDVLCDMESELAKLTSLLEEAHEQVVIVDRHNIVDDVLNLYTDPEILRARIKVQFRNEQGDDFGGLTKDMFTQFWKKVQDDCFTGCDTLIPRLPIHRDQDIIMAAIGRVISHMLMLRGKVPYTFCRCSLLAAAAPDSVISQELLLEDFLLYSEADDKAILKKVIDNTDELTDDDFDKLTDLFAKYGQQVMPNKDILIAREQIATIAKAEFCNKPMYLLHPMRTGLRMPGTLAAFWDNMNEAKIRVLFAHNAPTANGVIACLTVNGSLRNREQFSLDLLKIFLKNTESTLLTPFLIMVTGSADLPDEGIHVRFNDTSGAGRRPCVHTCGNVLELSMNYAQYDEFNNDMEELLTNPAYLEMGLR